MQDLDERDAIRAQYVDEPGKGQLVEQIMSERENAVAYGAPTDVLDAHADSLGYTPRARAAEQRRAAAAKRKQAAEQGDDVGGQDESDDKTARVDKAPPGRSDKPKQQTSSSGRK
jgi:hypothetical protein